MSELAPLSPGFYAFERVLVTESGQRFTFVARRPLAECANEMLRSAARSLGVTSEPSPSSATGDGSTVQGQTMGGKKQKAEKRQAGPVATPG